MTKSTCLTVSVLVVALAGAGVVGYRYWKSNQRAVPPGIASGNGRVEAKLVDITTKEALRVEAILVNEGDLVSPGQVLVRMDITTLSAQLAEAKAKVAAAQEQLAIEEAAIVRCRSEEDLAKIEAERARKLVEERAGSQRDYDVRKTNLETATATLAQQSAKLQSARAEVDVAKANVTVIQTRIDDATLKSPVHGRVLYRLAEPGEVLGAGGRVLTVLNLRDIYMEIYLPAEEAAKAKIGGEARVALDFLPDRAAVAFVSFVSPEAQFTPKQVETRSERELLMFRVKIQIPEESVAAHIERIKTGIRGVGYVKIDEAAVWPSWLEQRILPQAAAPAAATAAPAAPPAAN